MSLRERSNTISDGRMHRIGVPTRILRVLTDRGRGCHTAEAVERLSDRSRRRRSFLGLGSLAYDDACPGAKVNALGVGQLPAFVRRQLRVRVTARSADKGAVRRAEVLHRPAFAGEAELSMSVRYGSVATAVDLWVDVAAAR